MKSVLPIVCLLPLLAFAQTETRTQIKKTKWELSAGAGLSYFVYSSSKIKEHFTSPDFRVGTLATRSMGDHFALHYGLRLGVRLKTNSLNYNPTLVDQNTLPRVEKLDETNSKEDQFFFEIPVAVQYRVNKLGLSLGAAYKNYIWLDDVQYSNYTSTKDVGIIPGISYQVTPRWRVGMEYYYGLLKFGEYSALDQSLTRFTYKAYHRFTQISISYSLRKR